MMGEKSKPNSPSRQKRRPAYDRELEWFLTESCSVMGERSAFGALVAAIERGCDSGNKGTKGCGRTIAFPFSDRDFGWGTNWEGQGLIARASACRRAWQLLTTHQQAIFVARYCLEVGKLPSGMHGALGDLAGVAIVVASSHDGWLDRLREDARRQRWLFWVGGVGGESIDRELRDAHQVWAGLRADSSPSYPKGIAL
jgi:hypothetical protein